MDLQRRQILYLFWLTALSPLTQAMPIGSLLGNKNSKYTQFLLERYLTWYQAEFFPFKKSLSSDEMNLVALAIRHMPNWNEFLNSNVAIDRFVVGQELIDNKVRSGRLSVYCDVQQAEVKTALEKVLKFRNAKSLISGHGGQIYGVGWDCELNIFKVFSRHSDDSSLVGEFKKLNDTKGVDYYPLRLVSSRVQNGRNVEDRLYRVQKNQASLLKKIPLFGPHILQVTEVLSNKTPQPDHWRLSTFPAFNLNANLEKIAEIQAQKFRFALDSIRYHSAEHLIAYYP